MSGISWKTDVGVNHVGAYQVSGRPYATGSLDATGASAIVVTFPTVTRWVSIVNHSTSALSCSFSANGMGSNYFRVHGTDDNANSAPSTVRLELKVSELYFSGSNDFDVVAGLTNIDTARLKTSSGTNWSGSSGVG